LLTENLHLREDILQLRNDLDGAPNKRALGGVKEQLEAQVQLLAQLVAGIGAQPKDKIKDASLRRYPTVGWGRGMADPLDGSDGRLPAIREDKSYPRRTMDAQEIHNVADTNSESPALGSPPVSHFRDEEPISFEKPATAEIKKETEDVNSLPANLETRRKKRDSTGTKLAIRRMSVFSSPEDEAKADEEKKSTTQVLPIRTGAKRKLSSREDEKSSANDFAYSRKAATGTDSAEESSAKEDRATRDPVKTTSRRDPIRGVALKPVERRALGDKSINTDPVVSPKKTAKRSTILEEKEALKKIAEATKDASKSRVRDRKSRIAPEEPAIIPLSQDKGTEAPQVAEISLSTDLPPKTPAAAADLFSPPSTEDSTRQQAGRDTPPPSDLSASENGRPGRRARAAVNYAEPSLAAKMRRPTEKLGDAVGKDGRPLHGMIVKKGGIEIKLESEDGSAWKTMPSATPAEPEARAEPGSPLSKKSTTTTSTSADLMKVRAEPEPILPSAASQAIAALIKDSKTSAAAAAARRRSSALRPSSAVDSDTERKDKARRGSASIYDFTSSSPPRSTLPASRPSSRSSDHEGEDKPSRTSRRHSSLALLAAGSKEGLADGSRGTSRFGAGAATAAAGHKRTVSGTTVNSVVADKTEGRADLRASRRRSMML